jgi:hypothetical protein
VSLAGAVVIGALSLGFHGCKSGRVLERQMADRRQVQLAGTKRAQTGRVCRGCQGSVVGSGGQRVVRESRRGGSSGVGRVGTRTLHAVAISIVIIVGMRPGHVLGDGVGRERGEATASAVARAEHLVATRAVESHVVIALDLRGGRGQEVNIHAGRGTLGVARVGSQV